MFVSALARKPTRWGNLLFRHFVNIYRLLNLYCDIFGTSSYREGRTSLRLHLRHMNECRTFHNINLVTFLLYILKIFT